MKNFFKFHLEWVLSVCGLILGVILIWFLVRGVTVIVRNANRAFGPRPEEGLKVQFDLEKAKQLDFKGQRGNL